MQSTSSIAILGIVLSCAVGTTSIGQVTHVATTGTFVVKRDVTVTIVERLDLLGNGEPAATARAGGHVSEPRNRRDLEVRQPNRRTDHRLAIEALPDDHRVVRKQQ